MEFHFAGQIRFARTLTLLASITVAVTATLPQLALAGLSPEADSLDMRIRELAIEGRFALAVPLAQELRTLDEASGADAAQVRWYEVWISSLQDAAALPDSAQAQLGEANRLAFEIRDEWGRGHYLRALEMTEQQVTYRERWLGPDHPETAYALGGLARGLYRVGGPWDADAPTLRTVRILRDTFGPEHFLTLGAQEFLAEIRTAQGAYESAERLLREILEARRQRVGQTDPALAAGLNSLADVYRQLGKLAEAEQVLREALSINSTAEYEWIPDPDAFRSSREASLELELAELYLDRGDPTAAAPYAEHALAVRRGSKLERSGLAAALATLASVDAELDHFERADSLLTEALRIQRNTLGPRHRSVAISLAQMARLREREGRQEEARALFSDCLDIQREVLGEDHPQTIQTSNSLASVLFSLGLLPETNSICREILRISDRPNARGRAFATLGALQLARKDFPAADSVLSLAADVYETERVLAGTGIARATFREGPYFHLAAAKLGAGDPEGAWGALERGQGRVLVELLAGAGGKHLTRAEYSEHVALYAELARAETEAAAWAATSRHDDDPKAQERWRDAHNRELEAESRLATFEHRVAEAHPVRSGRVMPRETIQSFLPPKSAIVGWLDVETAPNEVSTWGYVLGASGPCRWARLPDANSPTIAEFRRELGGRFASIIGIRRHERADSLARQLWNQRAAPLEAFLEGVDHLIVAGAGAMTGIPVEGLIDREDRYLADRFAVSYVPSATVFAWLHDPTRNGAPTELAFRGLLVGDPPFSEEQDASPAKVSPLRSAPGVARSFSSLPALVWSRREVSQLSHWFEDPTVLLGAAASEQEIERLARTGALARFAVLHFATHALVDPEAPGRSALVLSQVGLPDPRSAALAGENIVDGLVTAREIVQTWQLTADLVVLSACETALGRKVTGEGYIGFCHAFFQAGARSVIASLWKVDDEATALLMERFYRIWRGKSAPTLAEALRRARLELRDYTDEKGDRPFAHPSYWTGFVLFGKSH